MRGEWAGVVAEGTGWDGGLPNGQMAERYRALSTLPPCRCTLKGARLGGVGLGGEGVAHQPGGWGPVTLVQGVRARVGSNLNTERRGLGVAVRDFVGHEGPASRLIVNQFVSLCGAPPVLSRGWR